MDKKVIIIFGPQGSGKGTQAKILSEKLNIPHISTGDLFRQAAKEDKKIKQATAKGGLVSDNLVFKLIYQRIAQTDCENGYILDGFPRTVEQSESLSQTVDVTNVFEIKISDEESVKRLVNRRYDPVNNKIYNLYTEPRPTPEIISRLAQREDDQEDAIRERLRIYNKQTKILKEYYKEMCVTINGEQSIDKVAEDINKAL
ncbi:MAG: nucleoside monophosphate kinase [Candidatus Falkowbacteria bacterium]